MASPYSLRATRGTGVQRKKQVYLLLGEGGVGKTNIALRAMKMEYQSDSDPTIDDSFYYEQTLRDGSIVPIELVDLSGQDEYNYLLETHISGASAYIVVYSSDSQHTFDRVQHYLSIIRRGRGMGQPHMTQRWSTEYNNFPVMLLANKSDISNPTVSAMNASHLANRAGFLYHIVSAKDDTGVETAMQELTLRVLAYTNEDSPLPSTYLPSLGSPPPVPPKTPNSEGKASLSSLRNKPLPSIPSDSETQQPPSPSPTPHRPPRPDEPTSLDFSRRISTSPKDIQALRQYQLLTTTTPSSTSSPRPPKLLGTLGRSLSSSNENLPLQVLSPLQTHQSTNQSPNLHSPPPYTTQTPNLSQTRVFPSSHFSPPTPEDQVLRDENRTSSIIAQAGGRLRRSLTTPRREGRNIPVDEVVGSEEGGCGGCTIL